MPGLSVVYKKGCTTQQLKAAYRELRYRDNYIVQEFLSERNILIASSGYEHYPVRRLDDRNAVILIEGMIYNKSNDQIESALRKITGRILSNLDPLAEVTDFVSTSDGDYFILIYAKKQGKLLLFNDCWGKFPIFIAEERGGVVVSREMKFLLPLLDEIRFDPFAIAEFLLFECNLADKTVLRGVRRMPPAVLITARQGDAGVVFREETVVPVNFEPESPIPSRKEASEKYVELFREGLINRVRTVTDRGWGIVADLSGGYDSRGVFAGLCSLDAEILVCHDRIVTADEFDTAKKVAESYGKNLLHFAAPHPVDEIEELRRITMITDALVNCRLATSYFFDELEHEKTIAGRYAHFMGLGGEFIRQILQPKSFYRDVVAMLDDEAITRFGNITEACAILRLGRQAFRRNLADAVGRLPETDPWDQLRHLYFDRYRTFDNCGEDRHRMFNWTVTPYLGKDNFACATKAIPARDIDHFFFFDFIKKLDPKATRIPRHGDSLRIDSRADLAVYRVKRRIREMVRNNRFTFKMANRLRTAGLQRKAQPHEFRWIIEEILETGLRSKAVEHHINIPVLQRSLQRSRDVMQLYQWLTIVVFMDEIEKRYGDRLNVDAGIQPES
ncbi:MAG: hypothetical protein JSV44_10450 [Candidatus Zixiibacteriota bacterium]|nr:MAG: hypothetical protein JSV44_10450 [candidate division Zixibacteria bacterium]